MDWEDLYGRERVAAEVARSLSVAETLRRLGLRPAGDNHKTLATWCERWEIDRSHFDPYARQRGSSRTPARPLAEVLVRGSTYKRSHLKERLYSEGLKQRRCELCGQGESWRGQRMGLILDHINGVADDNRLENLRIVCPNCNATFDTHCGRQRRVERTCEQCGTRYHPGYRPQRFCSVACYHASPRRRAADVRIRRVERPPEAQLRAEIAASSYSAVGRAYGVSDNAIRKWLRAYERERPGD